MSVSISKTGVMTADGSDNQDAHAFIEPTTFTNAAIFQGHVEAGNFYEI